MYLPTLSSTSLYFHKTVIMRRLAEEAATLESSKSRVREILSFGWSLVVQHDFSLVETDSPAQV